MPPDEFGPEPVAPCVRTPRRRTGHGETGGIGNPHDLILTSAVATARVARPRTV